MEPSTMDEYEMYEEMFDPLLTDRRARRRRKPKPVHVPKKAAGVVVAGLADGLAGLEGGFTPTYRPSRYEAEWLLESLTPFYERGLIEDVLTLVKGGKEACVYCCRAHPSTGLGLLAAKVYRPRQFRSLRDDHVYRQGRAILKADGREVKKNDHRVMRAIGKKTRYGVQVQQTSWLVHEYAAMQRLYEAGGGVPRPVASGENAILMGYYGEVGMAAPTLNEVDLAPGEGEPLFREVLRNVELMLAQGTVHGDLSAYNVLYWEGQVVVIDFPQVTSLSNEKAFDILQRDVLRTCEYFSGQGVASDPAAIARDLWERYALPALAV